MTVVSASALGPPAFCWLGYDSWNRPSNSPTPPSPPTPHLHGASLYLQAAHLTPSRGNGMWTWGRRIILYTHRSYPVLDFQVEIQTGCTSSICTVGHGLVWAPDNTLEFLLQDAGMESHLFIHPRNDGGWIFRERYFWSGISLLMNREWEVSSLNGVIYRTEMISELSSQS